MNKLVLAILKDDDTIENYHEIDTDWISAFNDSFEKTDIPSKEKVYNLELLNMLSKSILDDFVQTPNGEHFKADTSPLQSILQQLLKI